jgi:hypothetical protein
MLPDPLHSLVTWFRQRFHLILTRAPRDAPLLLVLVLLLGIILLLVYAAAHQADIGVITARLNL